MLYAHASEEEQKQLAQAMKQTQNLSWYQRLHIIQLSSKGKSVTELSDLFGRCTATLRDYIKRYNKGGIEGLKRQVSSGAPPQIPFHSTEWEELLRQSPSQFTELETAARNWNQEFLVTYLHRYHGITVTRQAIAASLKRHGLRLNRGRLKVTSPDPLYTVKRDRLNVLKKSRRRYLEQL